MSFKLLEHLGTAIFFKPVIANWKDIFPQKGLNSLWLEKNNIVNMVAIALQFIGVTDTQMIKRD